MAQDMGKPLSPAKALTLSEAAQLLKARADAALRQAIAAVPESKGPTLEEPSKANGDRLENR
jgi:hypothetical protein